MKQRPVYLLPIIIFAQFAGTSLWFAGNAILPDLQTLLQLPDSSLGNITSSVQLGFIVGTLLFAFFTIADRYSPSKVFFICSLFAATANLGIYFLATDLNTLLFFRFLTGFFLAGIYPVGMKISADWYDKGLGKALGYLVGALVLGTAFPHFLKGQTFELPWETVIISTSILAAIGGILLFIFVSDGPYRSPMTKFEWNAIFKIFKYKKFRAAAFGYFGHMWELYAVWTFIPLILLTYHQEQAINLNISLWSFGVIGVGAIGCVLSGYWSYRWNSGIVAFGFLLISGICCLLSPFIFSLPLVLFLCFLLLWGIAVVGDSPQFSTLVAQAAPSAYRGSALTIVNALGFSITIFSIELINQLQTQIEVQYLFLLLVIGPLIGLLTFKSIYNISFRKSL